MNCNGAKSQSLKKTLKIGAKNRRPGVSFRGLFKGCQVDEVLVYDQNNVSLELYLTLIILDNAYAGV